MVPGTVVLVAMVTAAVIGAVVGCGRGDGSGAVEASPDEVIASVSDLVSSADTERVSTDAGASDPDSDGSISGADDGNAPLDPLDIRGDIIRQHELVGGDCFNRIEDLRAGRKVIITARVGCDEPHVYEVFHTFDLDVPHPSIHPGDTEMENHTLRLCYDHFAAFVGEIYELSEYEIGVFAPDRASFEHDIARYRGVHCWLYRTDMKSTDFSARGVAT